MRKLLIEYLTMGQSHPERNALVEESVNSASDEKLSEVVEIIRNKGSHIEIFLALGN